MPRRFYMFKYVGVQNIVRDTLYSEKRPLRRAGQPGDVHAAAQPRARHRDGAAAATASPCRRSRRAGRFSACAPPRAVPAPPVGDGSGDGDGGRGRAEEEEVRQGGLAGQEADAVALGLRRAQYTTNQFSTLICHSLKARISQFVGLLMLG